MTDAACIVLATLKLRNDAFTEFQCDRNLSLGLNLEAIAKVLNCANDEDALTITVLNGADKAIFVIESLNCRKVSY